MKLRYPLEAEDMMKLLDRAFDKAVEMTTPVKALAEGLKACAAGIEKVASTLAIVAHNQSLHHKMIIQMWETHELILKRAKDSALDTSMPGLSDDKSKTKPN